MEKEKDLGSVILVEEGNGGAIRIADDVVAMIASIAASEVEGVAGLASDVTSELLGKAGVKKLSKGVRVEIRNGKVIVSLGVIIRFGYSIPQVSQKIQTKVKNAIENMTGLNCTCVNIRFTNVSMN